MHIADNHRYQPGSGTSISTLFEQLRADNYQAMWCMKASGQKIPAQSVPYSLASVAYPLRGLCESAMDKPPLRVAIIGAGRGG